MHVFVTGASTGIGAALVRELARRDPNRRFTLVARSRMRLEALASALCEQGTIANVVLADLSDPNAASRAVRTAEAALGPIDLLVNNAGSQVVAPTAYTDIRAAEASLTLDLMTPLRLVREVLPSMLARRRGHIVNIASMAALAPTPGMTWYNAAKGGLAAASEALRGELAASGVAVTTVYPGIIQTDMADAALDAYPSTLALRLQPQATAAQLASAVATAVEKRRARLVYPRGYSLARWFPTVTRWVMDAFTPAVVQS